MDAIDLQDAYRQLRARRCEGSSAIPLDDVVALATTEVAAPGRLELLDRVLADPQARTEYYFLRDVIGASAARGSRSYRPPVWLAVAATLLITVGGAMTWRAFAGAGQEAPAVRSAQPVLALYDARLVADRCQLVWAPVAGADRYEAEVFSDGGAAVASTTTGDTVAVLVLPQPSPAADVLRWRVTAYRGDARLAASAAGRVRLLQ